ncbi:MAG: hypothetical protein IKP99_04575 [Bacteroidales bacterium]|nr:hypothetical protein [Bacteroidales bacterium]MBR6309697.1 hypothetical protein [Paludibacteraceae bacterium]
MKYYKQYTGTSESVSDALIAIGANGSYANRKLIASANGITPYEGTAEQNKKMLALLKSGKLIVPEVTPEEVLNNQIDTEVAQGDKKKKLIKYGALAVGAGVFGFLAWKFFKK